MSKIQNGQLMSNGKRFNRTTNKYVNKKMSQHLFDTYPKADESKVYEMRYTLKGVGTGRYSAIVSYGLKNFVNSDELDVVIQCVYREGQPIKATVTEKMEFHSAALNDYFINHADAT